MQCCVRFGALGIMLLFCCGALSCRAAATNAWFEIRCVDAQTGRGIPLVELETVNHLRFVSDNAGRIAFLEPDLEGREVFFNVRSHGYEMPKDGFGHAGVKLTPLPGQKAEIKLKRLNIAERLYRITGEGLYRDSLLLGGAPQWAAQSIPGLVSGQDSVQMARYHNRLYWFYGDTDRINYPLGQFRTSGATSPLPGVDGVTPSQSIPLTYFTNADGFSRPMMPLPERTDGVIWIDGLTVAPDAQGRERMVCHYERRKGMEARLEHGIAVFNDEKAIFEPVTVLSDSESWRCLRGLATRVEDGGSAWIYSGLPLLNVRVPARYEAVIDPKQYEAFTCLEPGQNSAATAPSQPPVWSWRHDTPPVGPKEESRWLKEHKIQPGDCRYLPKDVSSEHRPILSSGSVRWNAFRKSWIVIAVEVGGSSMLGEVWYSEGPTPVGPFTNAVKIVTHNRQSFYNPCQHDLFDEEGGRFIYFEGTYVNTFSGNPETTARYNYNQILYRLDLADPRLRP